MKGSQLRLQQRVEPVKYMHLYFINICVSSNKNLRIINNCEAKTILPMGEKS